MENTKLEQIARTMDSMLLDCHLILNRRDLSVEEIKALARKDTPFFWRWIWWFFT